MNVQDYRAAGFPMSQYIEEATIARAESNVRAAYIVPLVGTEYDAESEPYRSAILCLSFLYIMQQQAQATRAGGKTKNTPQSTTPTQADLREQYAVQAHAYLRQIDAQASRKVSDICRIYFKSNFFGLKN